MTSYTLAPFASSATATSTSSFQQPPRHPPSTLPAVSGALQQSSGSGVGAAAASSATGSTASLFSEAALYTNQGMKPSPYYTPVHANTTAAAAVGPHVPPLHFSSGPPYALRLPQQSFATLGALSSAHTAAASSTSGLASPSSASSASSAHSRFYYKLVARVGPNRFVSLYDGVTEYEMGKTITCPIRPLPGQTLLSDAEVDAAPSAATTARSVGPAAAYAYASGSRSARTVHTSRSSASSNGGWKGDESRGGLFVCRTPEEALAARIPAEAALAVAPRALLKCMCWGGSLAYGSSTLAFVNLRPVQVYPLPMGYRSTAFGQRELTAVSLAETRKRLPHFRGPLGRTTTTFREREEMGALTKRIITMDKKINAITRAQLGW